MASRSLSMLGLLLLAGCPSPVAPFVDAGPASNDGGDERLDGGAEGDAGQLDAGQLDAGQLDAGQLDAGQLDAGQLDAGLVPVDAGGLGSWSTQIGGSSGDEVTDVVATTDGVFVSGYLDGVLNVTNIEPFGNARGFIRRYDSHGTLVWERLFETTGADTIEAMLLEGTTLYAVGRTSGAFAGFSNQGQVDSFIVKMPTDNSSEPVIRQFGDERPQHPLRIERLSPSMLVVAGFEDDFVEGSAVTDWANSYMAGIELTATEAAFEPKWATRSTIDNVDQYFGLATAEGHSLVAGASSSTPKGPVVHRFDGVQVEQWVVRFNAVGVDAAAGLKMGPGGVLYAAGTTFTKLGDRSFGEQDAFVSLLDPATGHVTRTSQAGSSLSDWVRDVEVAADGTIYVVGETSGALGDATPAGSFDAMVLRFDGLGAWTGSWQHGTPGDDTVVSVSVASNGTLVIGGTTHGVFVAGATNGNANRDGFVMTLQASDFVAR